MVREFPEVDGLRGPDYGEMLPDGEVGQQPAVVDAVDGPHAPSSLPILHPAQGQGSTGPNSTREWPSAGLSGDRGLPSLYAVKYWKAAESAGPAPGQPKGSARR